MRQFDEILTEGNLSKPNYKDLVKNAGSTKDIGIDKLKKLLSLSMPKMWMDDFRNNKKVQKLANNLLQEIGNTKQS